MRHYIFKVAPLFERYKVFYERSRRAVLRASWTVLFIAYVALYIFVAIAFAAVYVQYPSELHGSTAEALRWADFLHFSFTTQSTLGYGDLVPKGFVRILAAAQSVAGICLNALAFGIIIIPLIRGKPAVSFPRNACYDPFKHTFVFRIMNRNMDELADMDIRVFISQTIPLEEDPLIRRRHFELRLQHDVFPLLPGLGYTTKRPLGAGVVAFRTASNLGQTFRRLGDQRYSRKYASPLSLGMGDRISVYVRGTSVSSGNAIHQVATYFSENITCGLYRDMEREYHEDFLKAQKLFRAGKTAVRTELFELIDDQSSLLCKQCVFHEQCPFTLANETRKSVQILADRP